MKRFKVWLLGLKTWQKIALGLVALSLVASPLTGQDSNRASEDPAPAPSAASVPATPTGSQTTEPLAISTFEAFRIKGTGAKVPRISKPVGIAALVSLKYSGSDNFVVWSIGADGSRNELLVNTIGRYQGTVLLDQRGHSVALSVETTGRWTGTIAPLSQADRWNTTEITTGSGDNVLMLSSETIGLKTMLIKHSGKSNFVVWSYSIDGQPNLLVNEIGDYSGEVLLPDQTYIISIQSEGNWGVSPPF